MQDRAALVGGGRIGIAVREAAAVEAADVCIQLVVLRAAVVLESRDLPTRHTRGGECRAFRRRRGVGKGRVIARRFARALTHLPVKPVVGGLAEFEGLDRLLLLGVVLGTTRAQGQRVPVGQQFGPGAGVHLFDRVVVDDAARGDELDVAAGRDNGVDQQVAGRVAGPRPGRNADVVLRRGLEAVVGTQRSIVGVADVNKQRRGDGTDAAGIGTQIDAVGLDPAGAAGGEDAAFGLQRNARGAGGRTAACGHGIDLEVAQRLAHQYVAVGGGGIESAADVGADQARRIRVERGADAAAGAKDQILRSDQRLIVALHDVLVRRRDTGAGVAGDDGGGAGLVADRSGENGVLRRAHAYRAEIGADELDSDRIVGAQEVGDDVLGRRDPAEIDVVGLRDAQRPPVAIAVLVGGLELRRTIGDCGVAGGVIAIRQRPAGRQVAPLFHFPDRAALVGAGDAVVGQVGPGSPGRDADELRAFVAEILVSRLVLAGGVGEGKTGLRLVGRAAGAGRTADTRRADDRPCGRRSRPVVVEGHRQTGTIERPAALLGDLDVAVFTRDERFDRMCRVVGVDVLDVGDVDHADGTLPGVEPREHDVLAARIGDIDLTVTVKHAQLAGTGTGRWTSGVQDLAEELDVAALHLGAVDQITVVGRIVAGADVAVVGNQRVFPGRNARLALGRCRIRHREGFADFEAVLRGVVGNHGATVIGEGGDAGRIGDPVGVHRGLVIAGRGQAQHRSRAGQRRAAGRQRQRIGIDAALDDAVDVQVARADEDAAVGHDAARREGALGNRLGVAADVEEIVHVALHEVAVGGFDIHRSRVNVALRQDGARRAMDLDQTARVADVAGQADIR